MTEDTAPLENIRYTPLSLIFGYGIDQTDQKVVPMKRIEVARKRHSNNNYLRIGEIDKMAGDYFQERYSKNISWEKDVAWHHETLAFPLTLLTDGPEAVARFFGYYDLIQNTKKARGCFHVDKYGASFDMNDFHRKRLFNAIYKSVLINVTNQVTKNFQYASMIGAVIGGAAIGFYAGQHMNSDNETINRFTEENPTPIVEMK